MTTPFARQAGLASILLGWTALLGACANEASDARYAVERRQLVAQLKGEIRDARVLETMGEVPRHLFVPKSLRAFAYRNAPLPIGHGQTISQPFIVAFMTEQLKPKETDRVLEIGTGSGYQAAVLSKLVKEVCSIEIVEPLANRAKEVLERLEYDNIKLKTGDGYKGWPEEAPFDAVIVTCAPDQVPKPLVDQLKEGGRMIIPVGDEGTVQELVLLEKKEGRIERRALLPVRFVPMTGESENKP